MALSNMLNEPRREITESLVGIVMVTPLVVVDYYLGSWLTSQFQPGQCPLTLGMIIAFGIELIAIVFLVYAAFATHALGEAICNALQACGIHLRPRNRRS
jgi:hypothetical protein